MDWPACEWYGIFKNKKEWREFMKKESKKITDIYLDLFTGYDRFHREEPRCLERVGIKEMSFHCQPAKTFEEMRNLLHESLDKAIDQLAAFWENALKED